MDFDQRTLLLVEDNDDDVFIFERAYKLARLPHPVQVIRDGEEAMEYVMGEGRYSDRLKYPVPFLVLLDLKLPLTHGFDVLKAIRTRHEFAQVPVVVLTSSGEPRDVVRAQELGALSYFVKPPTAAVLREIIDAARARIEGSVGAEPRRIAGDVFESGPTLMGRR